MHRRINVTLPDATIKLIDSIAKRGDRSRFINQAVRSYFEQRGREDLRRRLKQGAIARAARDLALASEWFAIDEQAWRDGRK
jgi:CopG family transcriptional regulator / antitoxin EndoAI